MYNVIYADPPWQQKAGPPQNGYTVVDGKQVWLNKSNKTRDLPYPTMTLQEIKELPVSKMVNKDSHLYLWATNKWLPFAFEVITAWGFAYSTTLVWAKNMMGGGLGGSFRINTEFLLFAKRGSLPAKETIPGTWFNEKRDYKNGYPCHSKKPEVFRKMIEKVSPGPYLEMFAREQPAGWDVYGNQVENSIIF